MNLIQKIIKVLKNKYYDWKVSQLINTGSGVSDTKSLDPFNTGNTDVYSDSAYHEDENQRKYQEAVIKMKRKINEKVKNKDKEGYENVLSEFRSSSTDWKNDLNRVDMLDLVDDEKPDPVKEALKKQVFYSKADVNTEDDKTKMIDKRIEHYEVLKVKKQIRKINKELRKAERAGDKELVKELWGEINELRRTIQSTKKDEHSILGR